MINLIIRWCIMLSINQSINVAWLTACTVEVSLRSPTRPPTLALAGQERHAVGTGVTKLNVEVAHLRHVPSILSWNSPRRQSVAFSLCHATVWLVMVMLEPVMFSAPPEVANTSKPF